MATTTQTSIAQHWSYFLNGVEQASNWPRTFILCYSSETIKQTMLKGFIVNGIIFLGSTLFLETFYNAPEHRLFGCSYVSLIGFPMYFALLGLNGKFYTPIAEKAFEVQAKSNPSRYKGASTNIVQSIASTIYTVIFYINCSVFASLLRAYIPTAGTLLSFLMNCAIMAYYSFEYKWMYMHWTLEQRLSFVEQHWAYFLGFGAPMTVLTFFLSTLHSGAIFSLVYPCYVVMATMATPKPSLPYGQPVTSGASSWSDIKLPNRIPLFYGVRKMNELVIYVISLLGGVHAKSIVSEKQKMAKLE